MGGPKRLGVYQTPRLGSCSLLRTRSDCCRPYLVLRLKLRLGLFDRAPIDLDRCQRLMVRDDFRALALEVAQASMVLLKNAHGLLPLAPTARIALMGPLADAHADLLGCWAPMGRAEDVESVRDGLAVYLKEPCAYERGCDVRSDDLSGEAHSRAHLGLPGRQQELVDALAATAKPLICVLMSGRPLVIPQLAQQASALLVAWHGGIRAGRAVADLLFGAANPSGRLTASFPRAEGQIPVYYAHKNTGRPASGAGTTQFDEAFKSRYLDEPNTPLFGFGFGLSYTTFAYSQLAIETPALAFDGVLRASAQIENTGQRRGTEVVQLHIRDLVANVTRPVRKLKAFERITLEPGEKRTIRFEIPAQRLGYVGLDLLYTVEPGEFQLWIGPDASSGLTATFPSGPGARYSQSHFLFPEN